MRRSDRQIDGDEALGILERGEYAVFSMVDQDGLPYAVPLSYSVVGGAIYFHCALEGAKLDHIRRDPSVCVCVVGDTEVMPAKFSTKYESCVVAGRAVEVFGEEKRAALMGLVAKYSPDYLAEGARYVDRQGEETCVVRVSIDSVTGKARR